MLEESLLKCGKEETFKELFWTLTLISYPVLEKY